MRNVDNKSEIKLRKGGRPRGLPAFFYIFIFYIHFNPSFSLSSLSSWHWNRMGCKIGNKSFLSQFFQRKE